MFNKIITSSMLVAASVAMANAAPLIYDFSTLDNVTDNVFSFTQNGITLTATATDGNFKLANSVNPSLLSWQQTADAGLYPRTNNRKDASIWNTTSLETLNSEIGSIKTDATVGDAWKDYICTQTKTGDITMKFSGLGAGSDYKFVLFTGVPWEQAGGWNSLNLAADMTPPTSITMYKGSSDVGAAYTLGTTSIDVFAPTAFVVNGKANSEGIVSFTLDSKNSHSNSLNYIAFSGTAIPEPSMFGLLAGLGALALVGARRRRK